MWSDTWFEDLDSNEKLLFIYLITNEKTNMLGIYEASVKKMSFETGIEKSKISKALKSFERVGKVKHVNNYVVLVNYLKHQNFNTNMKKSAIDVYNSLPKELKDSSLNINKENPFESFETLSNHFGMVRKVEVEYEYEVEAEYELENEEEKPQTPKGDSIDFNLLLDFFNQTFGKRSKVVSDKVKTNYKKRIKEGYSKKDIRQAMLNACIDDFHKSNNYKHCTIEFFSRADKLDKFLTFNGNGDKKQPGSEADEWMRNKLNQLANEQRNN